MTDQKFSHLQAILLTNLKSAKNEKLYGNTTMITIKFVTNDVRIYDIMHYTKMSSNGNLVKISSILKK